MPTTSTPASTRSAAVTELSTPPDMATTTRAPGANCSMPGALIAQPFIRLRVACGSLTVSPSSSSVMMIWQPRREVWVRPKARSSMSSSSSVASLSSSYQSGSTMTWQVEQASEPSQAPSISTPCLCAISSTERPSGASTSRRVPSRSMKVIFGIGLASERESSPLRLSGAERLGEVGRPRRKSWCRGKTPHPHRGFAALGPLPLPTACREGKYNRAQPQTRSLFRSGCEIFGAHCGAEHRRLIRGCAAPEHRGVGARDEAEYHDAGGSHCFLDRSSLRLFSRDHRMCHRPRQLLLRAATQRQQEVRVRRERQRAIAIGVRQNLGIAADGDSDAANTTRRDVDAD